MPRERDTGITRRQAIGAGVVGAATLGAVTATISASASAPPSNPTVLNAPSRSTMIPKMRMPVTYIPHGGGPWPFVDIGLPAAEVEALKAYLRSVAELPKAPPKALLVVSAHWEEGLPTVTTSEHPPMLYDYYGFPEASYSIVWSAPGEPRLAARVRELLGTAGIDTAEDPARGFDHGTFVPLKVTYPRADLPTVQLSLKAGLDPAQHIAMGRALAPLRDEGIFIVGSGMSYHNMRGFRDARASADAATFDAWLQETLSQESRERDHRLIQWSTAPAARQAHPREEHLMPLMVIAGAAGTDRGNVAFQGSMMNKRISGYSFGG